MDLRRGGGGDLLWQGVEIRLWWQYQFRGTGQWAGHEGNRSVLMDKAIPLIIMLAFCVPPTQ